jgi:hypothetical protein
MGILLSLLLKLRIPAFESPPASPDPASQT